MPHDTDPHALVADGAETVPEAGRFLGVSNRTVYRLIDSGELDAVRAGRRVLVLRKSSRDYLARLLEAATRKSA